MPPFLYIDNHHHIGYNEADKEESSMKKKMTAAICALAMLALSACGASVTEITLPESIELAPGESQQVEIAYTYDKEGLGEQAQQKAVAAAAISWSVEGSAVSVSNSGKVEALESGEATVTATTKQGRTASCTVTVTQPIEGIDLPESIELAVGGEDSASLTPTLTPENAQGVITWTSSDEVVATVDAKGVVSAVCKGSCTIRAEAGGVSAETDVTVTVAPTGITLAQSSGILTVGGSTALTVYTVPEEAEAADPAQLTYTSSNESVAAVSEDGTITAKSAGSAVITVTYQGSMTAEYSLTVRAKQTARPGTSTGSTAGTGGTGSAGATAPSGGGTAPAPSPTPDPAPTEPQHYHGNGSDAGVCPVCGVHYSPDVALDPDAPVNELPDLS